MNLQGNSILDVAKITGYLGKWEIAEDGTIRAKKVVTGELEVGSMEKPRGITIFDQATGESYCAGVRNGELVREKGKCGEITPPVISESAPLSEIPSGGSPASSTTATSTSP